MSVVPPDTKTHAAVAECAALLVACAPVLVTSGCGNEPPGKSLGSYRVDGRLIENRCGLTGERFRARFSYRVELRYEADVGYWISGSRPPVPGDLGRADGQFEFQLEQQVVLNASGAMDEASCVARQQERIDGRLEHPPQSSPDAGVATADGGLPPPPERLAAESSIHLMPLPGAECSHALAPRGPFAALPCTARYELKGTRVDP